MGREGAIWAGRLPASLLPVSPGLGSVLPLAKGPSGSGVSLGGGNLVRVPEGPPLPPAGTLPRGYCPGSLWRPQHEEWWLGGPEMPPAP